MTGLKTSCALAGRPTRRRRLELPKLRLRATGFTRIRKLLHNFIQSGDCLWRIVFSEGEAFLQKGSSSCIALRILLQDKIVFCFGLLIFLLIEEGFAQPEVGFRGSRVIGILRQELLEITNRQ